MRAIFAAAGAALLLCSAGYASAEAGRLEGVRPTDSVILFRSARDQAEADALMKAKVHETNVEILRPLVACVVEGRTRAVVTERRDDNVRVTVVEGDQAGCRGTVSQGLFVQE